MTKTDIIMANLNVEIEDEIMSRIKAKAALIKMTLSEYMNKTLREHTKDIVKLQEKESK